MDLTPKQQTSEAIRQAESILVMTGQHPSVDQASAVIGLSMILRKFGKSVTPVISDTLPPSLQLLDTGMVERSLGGLRDFVLKLDVTRAQVDKLQLGEVADGKLPILVTPLKGSFAPSDVTFDYGESQLAYDVAIVLGVPTRARIDRIYEQNPALFAKLPVINLDFHRSNENYGAVNLIEPNASSLCEMLVALAESLQGGIIDEQIATALLMGIVGSTDRFMAAHTTSKSLTVAAQMMAAGAKQQAVVKALYRDGRGDNRGEAQGRGGEQTRDRDRDRSDRERSRDEQRERGGDRNRAGEQGRGGESRAHGNERPPREGGQEVQREQSREAAQRSAAQSLRPSAPAAREVVQAAAAVQSAAAGVEAPSVAGELAASEPARAEAPSQPQPQRPQLPLQPPRPDVQLQRAEAQPPREPETARPFEPASAPDAAASGELPIIQPSHIELSDVGQTPVLAPVSNSAPAALAPAPATPSVPSPLSPADFSAAAQVLTQPRPERGSAPTGALDPAADGR